MKSGNTNCVIRKVEPYISGTTSPVITLYNYASNAQSAWPTIRFIFVKSSYITYL
jgi:hypothetical protein